MLSRCVACTLSRTSIIPKAGNINAAPEQTGGMESTTEDQRTDLYSLGVLFWTLLVGRGVLPFEGGPLELLHAIVQKRPMPVHEVRRDVPQVLALIIDKVCAPHYQPARLAQGPDWSTLCTASCQVAGCAVPQCTRP